MNPTCFKGTPSLIDVILTPNARRIGKVANFNCGLSDYHNFVATYTKIDVVKPKGKPIKYRSYKHFNDEAFRKDMETIPLSVLEIFDDVSDKHWAYSHLTMAVVDEHAPLKTRYGSHQCAHMNSKLRKAIYKKRMARNQYMKDRSNNRLWENYRKARNEYVNENRASLRNYFKKECSSGAGSNSFWQAIKPYFSDKGGQRSPIMLKEGEEVITDCQNLASVFNQYFHDIAQQSGNGDDLGSLSLDDVYERYENHPSVETIRNRCRSENSFRFSHVTVEEVTRLLSQLNARKSTGYDQLPAKLICKVCDVMAPAVTRLVNDMIDQCFFPSEMKYAEISPIFKKGDSLDKTKYRPVSVLSCVSKVFEKVINKQLAEHFYDNYAKCLSAYRKNHNTQSVLLKAVDDWKNALDEGKFVGALLMDLSKAFDVIPHGLLLAKMKAYGYCDDVIKLVQSYVTCRKQRVKINNARSEWVVNNMGVPQGSVLGPSLFNVFLNDLFFYVNETGVEIYNYADDNTLSYVSNTVDDLIININRYGSQMTEWFQLNAMKANPDKYQTIIFGRRQDTSAQFSVSGVNIASEKSVKLLGITIDHGLSFCDQAAAVSQKASRQVNAMMRLCNVLDEKTKLNVYLSFIYCNFMYCPAVWLLCSKHHLRQLEKINCRALRFLYNDFNSTYDELLLRGNHKCVKVIIMHSIAIEVYKCVHGLSPEYMVSKFQELPHEYNTRNFHALIQPTFRTVKYGFQSFSYLGSKIFNRLPNNIKEAPTLALFKKLLSNFKDTSCMDRIV